MNKTQLIEAMASEANMSKADAKKALNAYISVTEKALGKGDKITLVGFGTFSVMNKPGRTGRNPRTGAPIKISAKNMVKFKPGSDLTTRVQK